VGRGCSPAREQGAVECSCVFNIKISLWMSQVARCEGETMPSPPPIQCGRLMKWPAHAIYSHVIE
jgi:hypothetical protein